MERWLGTELFKVVYVYSTMNSMDDMTESLGTLAGDGLLTDKVPPSPQVARFNLPVDSYTLQKALRPCMFN